MSDEIQKNLLDAIKQDDADAWNTTRTEAPDYTFNLLKNRPDILVNRDLRGFDFTGFDLNGANVTYSILPHPSKRGNMEGSYSTDLNDANGLGGNIPPNKTPQKTFRSLVVGIDNANSTSKNSMHDYLDAVLRHEENRDLLPENGLRKKPLFALSYGGFPKLSANTPKELVKRITNNIKAIFSLKIEAGEKEITEQDNMRSNELVMNYYEQMRQNEAGGGVLNHTQLQQIRSTIDILAKRLAEPGTNPISSVEFVKMTEQGKTFQR